MVTISIFDCAQLTTKQSDIPVYTECFYCKTRCIDDTQLKTHSFFCLVICAQVET